MSVRVEFYGVPRQRAGTAFLDVTATSLGEALRGVARQIPELAGCCLVGDRPAPGYLANVNGRFFTSDPGTPLSSGDAVLLLSTDAGG